MRRFLYFLFAIFSFLILFTSKSLAASNFDTDYKVTYTVSANANTHVDFSVTLTNKTAQYYASSYSIQIGFKSISNVNAYDPDGSIAPNLKSDANGQNIELTFNKKVVGLGNKLSFNLSFDTPEIAQKIGKIWEIDIPGLAKQSDFQNFNVHVNVPSSLGSPTYIKPAIPIANGNLDFTKDQLGSSGISIAFGEEQIYKFNLTYHLSNPNLFPIQTEIALPPSTNYQDVLIDDISVKPINVTEDKDGNWLARYSLFPSKKLDVVVKGKVRISLSPKKEFLPTDKINDYLKSQPYWQVSDVAIKKLADSLKTPEAIYEYVTRTLSYDFSRVTASKDRVGAAGLLNDPSSAVCLEFTDLFVALARAAGIPAREVDGFAYTKNPQERPLSLVKDILHAWPEYYDFAKGAWIMVDPTWGNTTKGVDYFNTLDFDHFAFVIKGENSNYPVAAGGYKFKGEEKVQDVDVSLGDEFGDIIPTLGLSKNFSEVYMSGVAIGGEVMVANIGNSIVDAQDLTIQTKFLEPQYQKITLARIPPFGFLTVPVSFNKTPFLTNMTDVATITIGGKSISQEIKISPFIINKWSIGGGILIVIIIAITLIITIRSRHIPFPEQER
ncbi:MAG: transglutaminase family protein [Patescibacteria group bacterium]